MSGRNRKSDDLFGKQLTSNEISRLCSASGADLRGPQGRELRRPVGDGR